MITVQITEHELIVAGHANPENPEHKAVCAAVSAVCQMAAAWFDMAGIDMVSTDPREGGGIMVFDVARIKADTPPDLQNAAQITLMTLSAVLGAQAKAWPGDIKTIIDHSH